MAPTVDRDFQLVAQSSDDIERMRRDLRSSVTRDLHRKTFPKKHRWDKPDAMSDGRYLVRVTVTIAHEARHAWQRKSLLNTGSPPYVNRQGGITFFPFSNNDFEFLNDATGNFALDADGKKISDCLPDKAILRDGTDIGGSGGSAEAIIDSTANTEFSTQIFGELPGFANALKADTCAKGKPARTATERGAIRFGRAIDRFVGLPKNGFQQGLP